MKRLEQQVIEAMRLALAHYHTDPALTNRQYGKAHDLWWNHHWSQAFEQLYDRMMEIWRAYTPMPRGHYREKRYPWTKGSLLDIPVQIWIKDKVQPPVPTTEELLRRFDQLISEYVNAHPEPSSSKSRKRAKGSCTQAELWNDGSSDNALTSKNC